jgi:TolB-like protein
LRQTLSAIRKALGEQAAKSLTTNNESITLDSDRVWIDVKELEQNVDSTGSDELETLTGLYRGELLEGLNINEPEFEQWLSAERERARSTVFQLLSQLIERMEQDHRIEEAIKYGAKLLAMDPLQERIHRKLMGLYMAQGRHDVALNQFEHCRRELDEQLNVQPEKATLDMVMDIRSRRRVMADEDGGNAAPIQTKHTAADQETPAIPSAPLPDKPSIAVLPFTNMSADPEQEFFSDGISEDIITELSRFAELFVIARNSSFMFKGAALDIREIGIKLGVRYLLEGSVRKAANRIRVTAQLIDATTSEHIWAERYDREIIDIFEIQDELTRSIVSTIKGRVDVDLAKYAALKPTNNLSAYECVLRGQHLVHKYNEEDFAAARTILKKAIDLDPNYARAYGWLAYVDVHESLYWQMTAENISRAIQIGTQGLALDNNDSRCHLALGVSFLFNAQHEKAEHHFLKASLLNPNDDLVMIEFGRYKMYTDEPMEGANLVRRGMRQNPFHPNWYWNILARCLHTAKDYVGAISALDQIETVPFWSHAYFAACYTAISQPLKAKKHLDEALILKPDFAMRQFETIFPYRDPKVREEFLMGFQNAGFPE